MRAEQLKLNKLQVTNDRQTESEVLLIPNYAYT